MAYQFAVSFTTSNDSTDRKTAVRFECELLRPKTTLNRVKSSQRGYEFGASFGGWGEDYLQVILSIILTCFITQFCMIYRSKESSLITFHSISIFPGLLTPLPKIETLPTDDTSMVQQRAHSIQYDRCNLGQSLLSQPLTDGIMDTGTTPFQATRKANDKPVLSLPLKTYLGQSWLHSL